MKILFVGGTGLISSACSELALARGHELFILNRSVSRKYPPPSNAILLQGDIHTGEAQLDSLLAGHRFDAVVDFIAYSIADIERDIRLFRGRVDQFVFISSASAYQKPVQHYLITEATPLENPFWKYSRNKIACENRLMDAFQKEAFPVTIVRPSLTYGPTQIPLAVSSWSHPWTLVDRMKRGEKVIVPGDGTSLWVVTWNEDFATGLLGLLGNRNAIGEAFHITSDEILTWNQLYEEVYNTLELMPNLVHIPSEFIALHDPEAVGSLIGDKSNSLVFDNSKIKRFVPDFACEVRWAGGVRRALSWFEAHSEFQVIDADAVRVWDRIISSFERAY